MNAPTPPPGFRLIDPKISGPKRWDDIYHSGESDDSWCQITTRVNSDRFDNHSWDCNGFYARRVEAPQQPCWRCAKTDPPKDDRVYMVQVKGGQIDTTYLYSGEEILRYALEDSILRWLDYPNPPPVQSEEEKAAEAAFQEWYRTLGQNIQAQPKWTAFEAWFAALAYAKTKQP